MKRIKNSSGLLSMLIMVIALISSCSSKQTESQLEDMDKNKALF